jgi:ABC-type lipoprotein release transport system permease subunit
VLISFWVIMALLAALLSRNARYAVRRYLADRNRLVLSLYLIFLFALGTMVIHITIRVMNLVQTANETEVLTFPRMSRAVKPSAAMIVGD